MIEREGLDRDQRLIVIHAQRHVVVRARGGMEHAVGRQRAGCLDALCAQAHDRRCNDRQVLVAERPVFASMRIKPGDRQPRLRDREPTPQVARGNPPGVDDEFGRQARRHLAQRQMNRHRHHRQLRRPQHHDRACGLARRFQRETREKFRVARVDETVAVEHGFGNRVGDDGGRPAGDRIGYGTGYRGDGGGGAR